MLSHLGLAYDEGLAAAVPGIDFIVGGHDHLTLTEAIPVANPAGKTTWIVQAGEFYEHVGKLRFTVDADQVTFDDYQLIDVDENVPPAPRVQAVVDSLKAGIVARYGDVYGTVLADAADDVRKTYDPDRAEAGHRDGQPDHGRLAPQDAHRDRPHGDRAHLGGPVRRAARRRRSLPTRQLRLRSGDRPRPQDRDAGSAGQRAGQGHGGLPRLRRRDRHLRPPGLRPALPVRFPQARGPAGAPGPRCASTDDPSSQSASTPSPSTRGSRCCCR